MGRRDLDLPSLTFVTSGTDQELHLISSNIKTTRAELVACKVAVSGEFHFRPEEQPPASIPYGLTTTVSYANQ